MFKLRAIAEARRAVELASSRRVLPFVLAFLGLAALAAPARAFQFDALWRTYPVGQPSAGIALGDLDGDGLRDIVIGLQGSDVVLTYRNIGGGSFEYSSYAYAPIWPVALILSDVTEDGHLDIVVCEYHSNAIRIIPGAGTDTLTIPVGTGPGNVVAGDINSDGHSDLVVANYQSATISVILGTGIGGFRSQVVYATALHPMRIALNDFDGDGFDDVAVACNGIPSAVSLFFGSSAGSLSARTDYSVGGSPNDIDSADLDQDGDVDLAISNGWLTGGVRLLLNDGHGHFSPGPAVTMNIAAGSVAIADFDDDGLDDLVTMDAASNLFCITFGAGGGLFGNSRTYQSPDGLGGVEIADVTGEGLLDIVFLANEPCVCVNRGQGYFGPQMSWPAGKFCNGVALGRVNGDSYDDLLVADQQDTVIAYFEGGSAGLIGTARFFPVGRNPASVALSDLNLDGRLDALAANYGSNSVSVLLGDGLGSFGSRVNYPVATQPWRMGLGQLNGDASPDVAVACRAANVVSVLLNSGTGALLPKVDYATATTPEAVAIADLNRDGVNDLVVACSAGLGRLSVFLGHGDGSFSPRVNYASGIRTKDVALADVDGDTYLDAIVGNISGIAILLGNGQGGFSPLTQSYMFGAESVVARDFNGDGFVDVALNCSSGWVTVLLGHGNGLFTDRVDYGCADDAAALCAGDVNGDGWPDLVSANYWDDSVTLLRNNALATSAVLGTGPAPGTNSAIVRLSPPSPNPSYGPITFDLTSTTPQVLELLISDLQGRVVRRLPRVDPRLGPTQLHWDGQTEAGLPVRSGVYWIVARGARESASRRITIIR